MANYFKAHGWQTGKPVAVRATVTKPIDAASVNGSGRPSVTLAEHKKQGVQIKETLAADLPATLLSYQQPNNEEYWLGFNNFYVITRYNRSHLYAMAVYQLSEEIRLAHKKQANKKAAP